MDSVYAMLMSEQKKLKEKKAQLDIIINQQGNLPAMRQELSAIRAENELLKKEVRNAVETEVKNMFQTKYNNIDKLYDYPRQIDSACFKKQETSSLGEVELKTREQIRKRENEIGEKEKMLVDWETQMFQKSLQMEETMEQYNLKMNRMAAQKQDIQDNVRRLQALTKDYQHVIEAEERTKLAQEKLDSQKTQMRQEEHLIDMKIAQVEKDRKQLASDLLDQSKLK